MKASSIVPNKNEFFLVNKKEAITSFIFNNTDYHERAISLLIQCKGAIAIKRNRNLISPVDPNQEVEPGDIVFLYPYLCENNLRELKKSLTSKTQKKIREISVWAAGPDVGISVCHDARLNEGRTEFNYPYGNTSGQAGWDMGVNFVSLSDLAKKLYRDPLELPSHLCEGNSSNCGKIQPGQLKRLAINVHGNAYGQIHFNGKNKKDPLRLDNFKKFKRDLSDIGMSLTKDRGMVLIMGCNAALGKEGRELFIELSKIWSNCIVVGYQSLGYAIGGEMKRRGKNCTEPGMRLTNEINTAPAGAGFQKERREAKLLKNWKDLNKLPWAWEYVLIPHKTSTGEHLINHTIVAFDGSIVATPLSTYDGE